MTDITELAQSLKAAAENATPGEWCSDDQYGIVADAGLNGNYYIASCSGPEHRSNKRFIALANPANVLALVEALEKARQRITQMESRTVTDWIEHDGKWRPESLGLDELVYLKTRKQELKIPYPAGKVKGWMNTGGDMDVMAYKLASPQASTVTVKLPKLKMLEDYLAEVAIEERKQILVGVKLEFHRALAVAGIKVEAE